jgi:menaquinone-9 beta-reductase
MPDYDVAIVGANLAGSTAATLLGRQGARVALLERSPTPGHFKTVCTHFIHASATPTLERLGVADRIEGAGGVRNSIDLWTRYGWIRPEPLPGEPPLTHGYDIRREKLDPMLRELAAGTPGVDLMTGTAVTALLRDGAGRPAGVRTPKGDVGARVVVGADGRSSTVARLAGLKGRLRTNARFGYFAYYEDLPLRSGTASQMWLLDPDCAYAFPNDDGLTLLATMPHRDRLPEFKADSEAAFLRMVRSLPGGPDVDRGHRVSKLLGRLDMTNVRRPAAAAGVALVGDAAQASDPVWGVGCGFALRSGEWLADELAGALAAGAGVDAALQRSGTRHRRELAQHHWVLSDYATGRPFNALDKLLYISAARDPKMARVVHRVGTRTERPFDALTPPILARAAWTVARRRHRRPLHPLPTPAPDAALRAVAA